jgi:hypothetical protein
MGYREMIQIIRQERLTGIRNPDLLQRKIREKIRQQITARQMLPALERMRNIPLERYLLQEKGLGLLNMPNP